MTAPKKIKVANVNNAALQGNINRITESAEGNLSPAVTALMFQEQGIQISENGIKKVIAALPELQIISGRAAKKAPFKAAVAAQATITAIVQAVTANDEEIKPENVE